MIGKRIFAFIFGLMICWVSPSQDTHFSGFMLNLLYVNPAYAVIPTSGEIGLTYRNQWPGIPATFVTYGASLVLPVKSLNSGIGISALNDMQGGGVINRTSVGLSYGYLIELNNNWQVGAGLSASYVMKRFDADELVFRSDLLNDLGYGYGNVTYGNYDRSYPDFSVGFIARNKDGLSFGISANHVTRPRDSQNNLVQSRLPMKFTAFVGGKLGGNPRKSDFSAEPAVFYSHQKHNHELIWGSLFNLTPNFMLGAWLRQNTKFNFDAAIISAGFSWEKYNISYSYDVNLKKMRFLSTKMAAHEVTFLYRFEYKEVHKVKRFKKSECPAY